jgi:hypothetical protein
MLNGDTTNFFHFLAIAIVYSLQSDAVKLR